MSTFGDAMKALRSLILLEERVTTLGRKVEVAADQLVALDKRVVRVETVLALTLRDGLPKIEGPAR
jgi:hypothetical protein